MALATVAPRTTHVEDTLDLALSLGVLILESGGSTKMADRAFRRVLGGAGVDDGFAVWRLDFAAAGRTNHPGSDIIRPVGRIGENFRRVSAISRLSDRAEQGQLAAGGLAAEIARIRGLESPYAPWMLLLATASTAGLFARLQGAGWRSVTLALVAAAAGQCARFPIERHTASANVRTLACALVSAFVAAIGLRAHAADSLAALVGATIYLVPGLPLVNGFIDLASHQHLIIGVQRIASAALQCALLAIAVGLAVTVVW